MIGLINIQWFDNPGAVLLCYALQNKLDELGYDSCVIDYASGGGKPSNKKNIFSKFQKLIEKRYLLSLINRNIFYHELKARKRNYEAFRSNYLVRTPRFRDAESPLLNGYDTYIVGSDVVWKPEILQSRDAEVYFLDFIPKFAPINKISFAASVGTNNLKLLIGLKKEYASKIAKFDFISVREKDTADFIKDIYGKQVTCISDPVFLLDKSTYKKVMTKTELETEEYIYFYMLQPNEDAVDFAIALAQQTGYKIIYDVHDKDNLYLQKRIGNLGTATVSDGPSEFLRRICDAKYVVTNSFHGTAFSIIFEKEFFSFSCHSGDVDVSVRLVNLLKCLGLENRYNMKAPHLSKIDYSNARIRIQDERKRAIDFLEHALSNGVR